jgi:uncharacterized membrane protein YeiH
VVVFGSKIEQATTIERLVSVIDAAGTPAFAVVGLELAMKSGLQLPGVMLVGSGSAVGGGILPDVVVRNVPEILKPRHFLSIPVALACAIFLLSTSTFGTPPVMTTWGQLLVSSWFAF